MSESTDTNSNVNNGNSSQSSQSGTFCSAENKNCILLSTALVTVLDERGYPHNCRVILGSGSQSNFITTQFAEELKLPTQKIDSLVSGFNQVNTSITSKVFIELHSRISAYKTKIYHIT